VRCILETFLPFFEVTGPDGQQFRVELEKDCITIGRMDLYNDVVLEPDPQRLIKRKVHCFVEQDGDGWWIVDNGSENPPFVRRGAEVEMVRDRAFLQEGGSILILGNLTETSEPRYWVFEFRDPSGTRPPPIPLATPCGLY
jgi:pSer/pThr/pTyr-binding forkhead associated (FHA) protein